MINNTMISSERLQELKFYVRNGYPLFFSGGREDPCNRFNGVMDDVFTLTELVEEGFLFVKDYSFKEKKVIVYSTVPITLYNGINEALVDKNKTLQLSLDDFTNKDFASMFCNNITDNTGG